LHRKSHSLELPRKERLSGKRKLELLTNADQVPKESAKKKR
jgi:hypothetical protein